MGKVKSLWLCTDCGHTQPKWNGSCSSCKTWNTLVEEKIVPQKNERFLGKKLASPPIPLAEVKLEETERITSTFKEFDRLMGGGTVPGSLTLIAGSPGVGKSTLLLQLSQAFAEEGNQVLYVSGEESKEQTSLRAKRIGITSNQILIYAETLFSSIKQQIETLKPQIVILDSVQILYKDDFPSSPGSVVQVREIAMECMMLAKSYNIAIFLVGHVTKSGDLAGPKVLEHMVDTVLEFEGDLQFGFRLLRSVKNRFGPTIDIALFQMKKEGLKEVQNISHLFLEERKGKKSGSVISASVEGGRSFLLEVQALVATSSYPTPSRRSAGIDPNRLALLLAVMEKRLGYRLFQCDVFVSVAGGMKISEPAVDLGVLLAVASSFTNQELDEKTLVIGEVGLSGEVRGVSHIETRIKEAIPMGFTKVLLPKRNVSEVSSSLAKKIALQPITWVEDAIRAL